MRYLRYKLDAKDLKIDCAIGIMSSYKLWPLNSHVGVRSHLLANAYAVAVLIKTGQLCIKLIARFRAFDFEYLRLIADHASPAIKDSKSTRSNTSSWPPLVAL